MRCLFGWDNQEANAQHVLNTNHFVHTNITN